MADRGCIVYWMFPPGLSKASKLLTYNVSLSRPRSLGQLLSHDLPDRKIIKSGLPEEIAKSFQEIFAEKIAKTKIVFTKTGRRWVGLAARTLEQTLAGICCASVASGNAPQLVAYDCDMWVPGIFPKHGA